MLNQILTKHGPDDHGYNGADDAWIKTISGHRFPLFQSSPTDFMIMDIAHPLGMQVRFNGHIKRFLSVAQHSALVHDLVSSRAKFYGLMHDAPEAYLGDMCSPLKKKFPEFKALENKMMEQIIEAFEIPFDAQIAAEVKDIDHWIVYEEGWHLLVHPELDCWQAGPQPEGPPHLKDIYCWAPYVAYREFMHRFNNLTKEKYAA